VAPATLLGGGARQGLGPGRSLRRPLKAPSRQPRRKGRRAVAPQEGFPPCRIPLFEGGTPGKGGAGGKTWRGETALVGAARRVNTPRPPGAWGYDTRSVTAFCAAGPTRAVRCAPYVAEQDGPDSRLRDRDVLAGGVAKHRERWSATRRRRRCVSGFAESHRRGGDACGMPLAVLSDSRPAPGQSTVQGRQRSAAGAIRDSRTPGWLRGVRETRRALIRLCG
jgi:hypothetical protein